MSYSSNSLKGAIYETKSVIGGRKGDTPSLDYNSYYSYGVFLVELQFMVPLN